MGSSSTTPLSKLEVAEFLSKQIQARWPHIPVFVLNTENPRDLIVLMQAGEAGELKCSPDNLYSSYLQEPTELNALCENFIFALQNILEPDEDAEEILLPIIQNQQWLDEIEAERKKSDESDQSPTAFMPLVADLHIVFALHKNQLSLITTENLLAEYVDAGVPHQAVLMGMEVGVDNLRAWIDDIKIETSNAGYRIKLDSTFDSSLVILYEEWSDKLALKGEPVFAFIAQGYFMVADSASPQQVESLRGLARSAFTTEAYPLSPCLFSFKGGELILFEQRLH